MSSENNNKELAYYQHKTPITTRWSDNDQYGHVNNSIYYLYFDATVNKYLIEHGGLDPSPEGQITGKKPIGLVVQSGCQYHRASGFPEELIGGMTVGKLGKSSVTYHLGIFSTQGPQKDSAVATGTFTHVFVDPETRRPTQMTPEMRQAFVKIASKNVLKGLTTSKL